MKLLHSPLIRVASAGALALLLAAPRPAPAQTASPAGSAATRGIAAADEIILSGITVTARKRAENLQRTPVSVSAFTAEQLTETGVTELGQSSELAPNLLFDWAGPTPHAARVYIRGVGQDDPLSTADPGVGLYVDGVYLGRSFGSNLDLIDIERIEVLRGPQGTLYGKNTIGGAINVISAEPRGEFGGSATVTVGSDNLLRSRASLSFPVLEDRLFGRVALASTYRDGYFDNAYGGSDWDNRRSLGGRVSFRLLPSDSVDLLWTLERIQAREHPLGGDLASVNNCTSDPVNLLCTLGVPAFYPRWAAGEGLDRSHRMGKQNGGHTPEFSGTFQEPSYAKLARSADPSDNHLDVWGSSLRAEWDTELALVRSITAFRSTETEAAIDADSTAFSIAEVFDHDDADQLSQELQLVGSALDERLDWVLGAYYLLEETENSGESFFAPLTRLSGNPRANLSSRDHTETRTLSYASFAHADYKLTERITLTAGLRWTYEHKDFERDLHYLFEDQPTLDPVHLDLSDHWSDWSPTLGVSFQATDRVMLYASWSRGFKSGGFNGRADTAPATQRSYRPETVKTAELGLKSQFLDDRLQVNLAAFRSNYRDMQLTRFTFDPATDGFVSLVENAGRSRILGLEAELRARPLQGLMLSGSVGAVDAEYQTFRIDDADFSDRDFKNTPSLTFHLAGAYSFPMLRSGFVTLSASYIYRSKVYYNTNNDESIAQDAFGLLNGRIAWTNEADTLELALWGRNLLDREYVTFGLDLTESLGFSTRYWAPPRSVGLDATVRF